MRKHSSLPKATNVTIDDSPESSNQSNFIGSLIQWSKALVVGRKHNSLPKVTNVKINVGESSQAFAARNHYVLPTLVLSSRFLKSPPQHQPNALN